MSLEESRTWPRSIINVKPYPADPPLFILVIIEDGEEPFLPSWASSPYLGSQSHNIFISIISTFLSLSPYLVNHSFLIACSEGKKWNEKNVLRIFFPYLGVLLSTFPNERKKKKKKSKLHASWNTILTLGSIYSHFVYWIKGHFLSIIIIRSNKEDLNMILLVEDINQCYLTIQRG